MDENKNNSNVKTSLKEELAVFAKALVKDVSITNQDFFSSGNLSMGSRAKSIVPKTKEEAEEVIRSGDPEQLKELSQSFFYSSGFYRRLLTHYATILYYTPLLIPHMVGNKKKITEKKFQEKYFEALELINSLNFEQLCRHFALSVLVDGAYYGMIKEVDGQYCVQDLPYEYCRSRMKSFTGVDIVEFDVTWFDKIRDDEVKKETLNTFPKEVRKAYIDYLKGKSKSSWVRLPVETGIHFCLYEERPYFSTVIPSVINFGDYVNLEKAKDAQQLKTLVVQEIGHTSDGELIFEPEEAVELHKGLTNITKDNPYLDGITSYGKVATHRLLDDDSAVKNNLEKINTVLYAESGTSQQLFMASGNTSVERSIQNDIALMMYLANSFSIWLKNLINFIFSDKHITFGVEILPVGQYNVKDYQAQALNAAQYGYSFMIPSLAMGLEQNQLLDLKKVEMEVLKMHDVLLPLRSSYTETNEDKGGSEEEKNGSKKTELEQEQAEKEGSLKPEEERSEKTLQNRESSVGGES